jgi:hypothetical protein
MSLRLTFGSEKDKLRMVVENGVDESDPRVMSRTNQATQLLMTMRDPQTNEPIIPVNCMAIAEVDVVNDAFLLPFDLESAIHIDEESSDTPRADGVTQGSYNILNPFTYVDPSLATDNPFIDQFMVAGGTSNSQLLRSLRYPGFGSGRIKIIGPKAYLPITQDSDPLLVQNVPALITMIQFLEYKENEQGALAKQYYDEAREMILGEIKRHMMDPRWMQKRKADYERDLLTFAVGSGGWMRARVALEVPGAMLKGRRDLLRLIDRAQLRMMEAGLFKGCIEEFNASITDGHIYTPSRVQSVLAASLNERELDIRSLFFKYLSSGPGAWDHSCDGRLDDEGDIFFPNSGTYRRKYRALVGSNGATIVCACKLRWEPKKAEEQLVIRNLEANRIMASVILLEEQEKWTEANAARETVLGAKGILQDELGQYLAGVKHTIPFSVGGGTAGMSAVNLGEML